MTTMNRRQLMTAAALTAVAVTTGACKGGNAGSGQPGGGGGGGGDKGSTQLTYWSMWKEGEDQQKVIKSALDQFSSETGIKVDVQWSGREVLTQVVPRLNSGNPPDLVDGGAAQLTTSIAKSGQAHDMTALYGTAITGEQKKISEVVPEKLMSVMKTEQGQPFMVPYEITGSQIWFNGKTEDALKSSPPKTWDELISFLDKKKAEGRTPIALDGDIKDYCGYWLGWAILRLAGKDAIVNAAQDKTGEAFNGDEWVKATDAIGKMIKSDYFPKGFNGTKFPTQQSAWADGTSKTDLILMGSWLPSEASQSLKKSGKGQGGMEFESFPFPSMSGGGAGDGLVEAEPIGFTIPKKARHADAAEKFIAYFMNKDRLGQISSEAQNLTPRTDIEPPKVLAGYAKEFAEGSDVMLYLGGAALKEPKWQTDVWQPAIADFFGGQLDAAGFRKRMADKTAEFRKNQ